MSGEMDYQITVSHSQINMLPWPCCDFGRKSMIRSYRCATR